LGWVRSDGRLPTSTRRWEASYSHRGTALPATTRRMSKAIGRPAEAAGGSNQALAAGRLAPPRRATTAAPGVPSSDPTDHTATRSLPPVPAPGPGAQNALLLHVPRSLSPPPRRPPSSSNTGSTCVKREDAPQSMTPLQSLYNPRRPRRRSTARRGREAPVRTVEGFAFGQSKGDVTDARRRARHEARRRFAATATAADLVGSPWWSRAAAPPLSRPCRARREGTEGQRRWRHDDDTDRRRCVRGRTRRRQLVSGGPAATASSLVAPRAPCTKPADRRAVEVARSSYSCRQCRSADGATSEMGLGLGRHRQCTRLLVVPRTQFAATPTATRRMSRYGRV